MSSATDKTVTVEFNPTATSKQSDVISAATPTKAGCMSAAQAAKLDGINPGGANTLAEDYVAGGGNGGTNNALGDPVLGMNVPLQFRSKIDGANPVDLLEVDTIGGAPKTVTAGTQADGGGRVTVSTVAGVKKIDANANDLQAHGVVTEFIPGSTTRPQIYPAAVDRMFLMQRRMTTSTPTGNTGLAYRPNANPDLDTIFFYLNGNPAIFWGLINGRRGFFPVPQGVDADTATLGDEITAAVEYGFFKIVGRFFSTPEGGTLASAATITPTRSAHVVSGVAAIGTITVPYPTFCGVVDLVPTGAWTWTNAGNIAIAGTAVVGRTVSMRYMPSTGKWYPSYV